MNDTLAIFALPIRLASMQIAETNFRGWKPLSHL